MTMQHMMRRFAKWHIWIGWLAGVPLVMWTLTGLVMVARPIEEVRGSHLRIEQTPQPVAPLVETAPLLSALEAQRERPVELTVRMAGSGPEAIAQFADGSKQRFAALTGKPISPVTAEEARTIVARSIQGGKDAVTVTAFPASDPPFDLRRPIAVWQVALRDGTHVYVDRDLGTIAAVRTRWWRIFDFMWGLHIMDLETREDTHHPILIAFATIALVMSITGGILMFRRRKAKLPR